jgi:hypothetical protein
MAKLIFDTNVFYDLADGSATPAVFAASTDLIFYSPLSVLEIAGKWSGKQFDIRKAAAKAILECGASELPDQDSFLAHSIFGYTLRRPIVRFHDAVVAMANSRSVGSLEGGVANYLENKVRRVDTGLIERWRGFTEGAWVTDMESIQDREISGFSAWRQNREMNPTRRVPRLTGAARQKFMDSTLSPNWNLTLVSFCHQRALLTARKIQPTVPDLVAFETVTKACESLACYCGVYTQYMIRLLTKGALPDRNDSGDLELFIHAIDDDHVIVTSEKKWKTMADLAGFGQRVRMAR